MEFLIYILAPIAWIFLEWRILATVLLTFILYLKIKAAKKPDVPSDYHVVIIGAGVSGICMGKKLNDLGIKFTILEKSKSLGGTWYDNVYPGCACDVPSHLYSYSFFLNPGWSRNYSRQEEILAYLQRAASKFGVSPHIRFNTRIVRNVWDKTSNKWIVTTASGEKIIANVIISGSGALHVPKIPSFKGIEQFQGDSFHTALWRKDYNPQGKRVAVIGTGASAVQAVPNLEKLGVKSLTVFQRTACWSPPRLDYLYPEFVKKMFAWLPFTNIAHRYFIFWRNEARYRMIFATDGIISKLMSPLIHKLVKKHIKMVVKDQSLAQKLTPRYDMGCKRITPSDDYLQTFNKDNVTLVTDTINEITKDGIKTNDGTLHQVDTILFATGFDLEMSTRPFDLVGLSGQPTNIALKANFGITHPEYPNAFVLLGPGTGLGHNSIIFMIECQVNYAADAIVKMINTGAQSMSLKPEVLKNYSEFASRHMKGKVFADNSQVSGWYRNEEGENWTLWPLDLISYWWYTRQCTMDEFILKF